MGSGEVIILLLGILIAIAIIWFVFKAVKVLTKIDEKLTDSPNMTGTRL